MPRRIFLVEDSSTMRRMISALLADEGYEVSTAVDGLDGLAKVRGAAPDLIISDYEMPELDGPGFCRAIKADPETRGLPVIMLTTLGAVESKVVGLDAGADDYLEKPKSPQDIQELYARIRAQLRISDLRRELADRNEQLEAARRKTDLELGLARKVQLGLMPRPPTPRGELSIAVRYKPANALGGDLYDFTILDGDRLGVLVADVSGHGVNSALLSGMVKTMAAPLTAALPPAQVLAGLDAAIGQFFPEAYFCTGFYLVIDEHTGAIEYAGVGHPPALIVGRGGVRALESDRGLLGIGMFEHLESMGEALGPGESLLVYTDGLTDAMDPADVLFGDPRIRSILEAHKHEGPSAILDALEAAVAAHVAPGQAGDDINLVLIQRASG